MTPFMLKLMVEAWQTRRDDDVELAMAQAYHTAGLMAPAFHQPKRFPRRFEDFFKRTQRTPAREQTDIEKWSAFARFAKGAG